jgi:hypothetical protein
MDRRTRREHFSSAALSITDDLLHRNILLLRAINPLTNVCSAKKQRAFSPLDHRESVTDLPIGA